MYVSPRPLKAIINVAKNAHPVRDQSEQCGRIALQARLLQKVVRCRRVRSAL